MIDAKDAHTAAVYAIAAPYRAVLDVAEPGACLSDDEQNRAASFIREADRERFVAAHCLKRLALAWVCNVSPQALIFFTTAAGKPHLARGFPEFNLTHGGDWVGLAIHPSLPVGIDIEADHDAETWDEVLPQIRSPADPALLPQYLWTAKEALLKCEGCGFGRDPRGLSLTHQLKNFGICSAADLPAAEQMRGQWQALAGRHLLAVASPARRVQLEVAQDAARCRELFVRPPF